MGLGADKGRVADTSYHLNRLKFFNKLLKEKKSKERAFPSSTSASRFFELRHRGFSSLFSIPPQDLFFSLALSSSLKTGNASLARKIKACKRVILGKLKFSYRCSVPASNKLIVKCTLKAENDVPFLASYPLPPHTHGFSGLFIHTNVRVFPHYLYIYIIFSLPPSWSARVFAVIKIYYRAAGAGKRAIFSPYMRAIFAKLGFVLIY